jgi:hypothetical protein
MPRLQGLSKLVLQPTKLISMGIFIRDTPAITATRNQRLGHFLTLILAGVGLFIGLNLRDSLLYETLEYFDPAAGIRIQYPVGWLVDTNTEEYLFQAEDTSRIGYRTTIQISTVPISGDMTARNVFDDLSYQRSIRLSNYRRLRTQYTYALPDGEPANLMEYRFVADETNPFQQSFPSVVYGRDVLIVRRGQGILITFLADVETYESDLAIFDRFLSTLIF